MRKSNTNHSLVGTWVSAQPFDSDDYLVEYTIKKHGDSYRVMARDFRDGERMKISKVKCVGDTLQFESLMPSTGRKGVNRFTARDANTLMSEFTFTVVESLKRVEPEQPTIDMKRVSSREKISKKKVIKHKRP